MGTITDTAKVGLVVVIAAIVMIGGYALVRGSLFGTASTRYFLVDFENGEAQIVTPEAKSHWLSTAGMFP